MFLNLHDLVRLELVDEPEEVRHFLKHILGIFETDSLDEEPDIRITFTDQIKLGSEVKFVGTLPSGETTAAYDDELFYITSYRGKISLRLRGFDLSKYELICEDGIHPSELYNLLVFFFMQHVLLKKNATFLHSSAVFFKNKGLLFCAWRDVGKTSMALKFLSSQAEFMSDDLTIAKKDGTILAYPTPLHLFEDNYRSAPQPLSSKGRRLFNLGYMVRSVLKRTLPVVGGTLQKIPIYYIKEAGAIASRYGRRILPFVVVPFSALFPQAKIKKSSTLDVIFFLTSTAGSRIEIEQTDSEFVVDKILYSLLYEINSTVPGLYEIFGFASPDKGQKLMEERENRVKEIVNEAFKGKQVYYVKLPLNFDPDQAFNKLIECL